MTITMTKEALVARLKDRLKAAFAEEKQILAEHEKEEKVALIAFKAKLREALKWDYKTTKEKCGNYRGLVFDAPVCPNRERAAIDRVYKMILMSTSKSFSIKSGSDIAQAISWLPKSERISATICD